MEASFETKLKAHDYTDNFGERTGNNNQEMSLLDFGLWAFATSQNVVFIGLNGLRWLVHTGSNLINWVRSKFKSKEPNQIVQQ